MHPERHANGQTSPNLELMCELLDPPLVSITRMGKALGIGPRRAKKAADRGQVETVDIGEQKMVVTAPLKRRLGLEPAPARTKNARLEG